MGRATESIHEVSERNDTSDRDSSEREFLEIVQDFTASDRAIVGRLLERLAEIVDEDGVEAALTALRKANPKHSARRG